MKMPTDHQIEATTSLKCLIPVTNVKFPPSYTRKEPRPIILQAKWVPAERTSLEKDVFAIGLNIRVNILLFSLYLIQVVLTCVLLEVLE